MKELKKLLINFEEESGINLSLIDQNQNAITGELGEEGNICFDFLYKGEKLSCIVEGKTEQSVMASKMLKAMLASKESSLVKGKADYLLKTLLGMAGSRAQTEKYKINITSCVVILIQSNGYTSQIYDFLPVYTACIPIKIDKNVCALCLGKSEEEEDYLSYSKFAKVLCLAIEEELGIKIKVGVGNPVSEFEEINGSYLQAKKALEMGEVFAEKQVYSYSEILPVKMISFLNEKEKAEFLKPFKQILKNEELTVTAQEFLNCGLNVKKTAEKLFVHRNTLSYRLNKIEKQVGLDLRNFNDAVTFRMVCLMYKLKEKNE